MRKVNESPQHLKLKEIFADKMEEWYHGATRKEHAQSGHRLDVYTLLHDNIKVCIEIIWGSGPTHFSKDMDLLYDTRADVKIAVASKKVRAKKEFTRRFSRFSLSQRDNYGIAACRKMLDGERILRDSDFLDSQVHKEIDELLDDYRKLHGLLIIDSMQLTPTYRDNLYLIELTVHNEGKVPIEHLRAQLLFGSTKQAKSVTYGFANADGQFDEMELDDLRGVWKWGKRPPHQAVDELSVLFGSEKATLTFPDNSKDSPLEAGDVSYPEGHCLHFKPSRKYKVIVILKGVCEGKEIRIRKEIRKDRENG